MNFLTHRWVRGKNFWGREEILARLAKRYDKFTWILGNRRAGKTSLLRQVELLLKNSDEHITPLYMDFQGAGNDEGLKMAFLEAFDEEEECAKALNLDLDDLETKPLSSFLYHIKRALKRSDQRVLFLIDEAEELVDISMTDPQVLSLMRKFFHGDKNINVFLTSSYVLHEVQEQSRTSQFIQEFLPPVPLFPFSEGETMEFLLSRGIEKNEARKIYHASLGNPYITQNLGEKTLESGFEHALAELVQSKFFKYFFESNFKCLPRNIRENLAEQNPSRFFSQLVPGADELQYLIQSTVMTADSEGAHPHPLLNQVFDYSGDSAETNPSSKTPDDPGLDLTLFLHISSMLSRRKKPLSALLFPHEDEGLAPSQASLDSCFEPPSIDMLKMSDEKTIFNVLQWASPEYISSQKPDQRTQVYLAGLMLGYCLMNQPPHAGYQSISERMQAIRSPFRLTPDDLVTHSIPAELGMILLKALSPNPGLRYKHIDLMMEDMGRFL